MESKFIKDNKYKKTVINNIDDLLKDVEQKHPELLK